MILFILWLRTSFVRSEPFLSRAGVNGCYAVQVGTCLIQPFPNANPNIDVRLILQLSVKN